MKAEIFLPIEPRSKTGIFEHVWPPHHPFLDKRDAMIHNYLPTALELRLSFFSCTITTCLFLTIGCPIRLPRARVHIEA